LELREENIETFFDIDGFLECGDRIEGFCWSFC
jgi:hypothetical protein